MVLPPLKLLLEVEDVEEHLSERSLPEARTDPAFVLHTSGSTGIPKPLTFSHEFISRIFAASLLPPPSGYVDINRYVATGRFFMTLPSFHIAGLAYSLIIAAYHGSIPVYPLPGPPPSTESFISAISNTNVDWAFVPPVVIDELGKNPDLLEAVSSRLKYAFFTGGSVPKSSGDIVATKLPIWQVLGSSECASLPLVHADTEYNNAEDWVYIQLNPSLKSEMRHRIDNLHELVIVRNEDTEHLQPVFAHFPELQEYETRDLFKPHPSKLGLWAYHSRQDDIVVFLNGEKTSPVSFEEEVIGHPEVKAALVIGAQRLEAALLVELATDASLSEAEKAEVIERIWPVVEKANKATPAHARISKSKILLVDPNKPMLRAGKGTVQRSATLALYAEEIERLYQQDGVPETIQVNGSDQSDIAGLVRNLIAPMLGIDDLDFFQLGMDSLSALRMQRALKTLFPGKHISLNTIYSNPSIGALVEFLEKTPATNGINGIAEKPSSDELASVLDNFMKEIDAISRPENSNPEQKQPTHLKVLLTGSTGALGSYILHRLLSMPEVAHIYCLNRTSDAQDRQLKSNQSRGLTSDFPPERVTFLTGDLTKQDFGLPTDIYKTLLSETTHIIHNAWPVNFNLPLTSFKPSLSGVLSLIHFSALSKQNCHIQFLSSISSVSFYPGDVVAESVITDLSAPASMGYGQSKYIAERLLDHASNTLGISTSCIRIGQLAGAASTTSGWKSDEWLPSLVASSGFIGAIPATLGDASTGEEDTVDWIPIDQLADVVVELVDISVKSGDGLAQQGGVSMFHCVHPKPVTWSSLLVPIKKALEETTSSPESIAVVPYENWLSMLKARSSEAEASGGMDAETLALKNPAIKLLDFYEALGHQSKGGLRTKLSMEKTLQSSPRLRDLGPLEDQWVTGWVKEWVG